MRTAIVALVVALASWTGRARAEGAATVQGESSTGDPLVPTSIAVASTGVVTSIAGALIWSRSDPRERCGALGCLPGPRTGTGPDAGSAMMGLGAGLAVAGAVGLGVTLGAPLERGEERDGPVAATAGLLLTSLSAGALGGGLAFGGMKEPRADFTRGVPFFVTAGVLAAGGIPLLVVGASAEDEAERAEERRERAAKEEKRRRAKEKRARHRERLARGEEIETEMRSPAMVGIGSGLLVAGTGGTIALAVAGSQVDTGGWFGGLNKVPFILGGILCFGVGAGAGIPLVVVGSRKVPAEEDERPAPRSALAPSRIQIGPGSGSVEWQF